MTKADGCTQALPSPSNEQRTLVDRDRRRSRRIRLQLETVVPVVVKGPGFVQRGFARNVSEGGMLIEMERPPSIGARVEVRVAGVKGSLDAPDAVTLFAEVRHQLFWRFKGSTEQEGKMNGVGVRFVERLEPTLLPSSSIH